jgi:glycine oxidase
VIFGDAGYVVPRADGRIVCGSTLEFVGFRNEVTAAGVARILSMAIALVPALESATVTRMWSNFRPYTPDEVPVVGETGVEGLTVATGHYRSGILMAPITATLVRERVLEGRVREGAGSLAAVRASLGASGRE